MVNELYKITNIEKQKAKEIIGQPLSYAKLAKLFNTPLLCGSQKIAQIKEWERNFKILKAYKPTRFTIQEIYETPIAPLVPQTNKENVKNLKEFCNTHYLTLLSEVDESLRTFDKITYVCDFHKDKPITTDWDALRKGVGCPYCFYPMSRLEVMLHLGLKGSIHRGKIGGMEYDIVIPNKKILIEVDGYYYHQNDTEEDKIKKERNANEYGYEFYRLIEQKAVPNKNSYKEGNIIYILPYSNTNQSQKEQMIKLFEDVFDFKYYEGIWYETGIYMREWKKKAYEQKLIDSNSNLKITQYDNQGNVVKVYNGFSEIKDEIKSGHAFGYDWIISAN